MVNKILICVQMPVMLATRITIYRVNVVLKMVITNVYVKKPPKSSIILFLLTF